MQKIIIIIIIVIQYWEFIYNHSMLRGYCTYIKGDL